MLQPGTLMYPVADASSPGNGLFLLPLRLLLSQGPSHLDFWPHTCPLARLLTGVVAGSCPAGAVGRGRNLSGFLCGFRFVEESDRCHCGSETRNLLGGQNSCGFCSEIPVNFKKSKPSQSRNPLSLVTLETNARCAKRVGREPRVPASPAPGETPAGGHGLGLRQLSGHQQFSRNPGAAKIAGQGRSGVDVAVPPAPRRCRGKQPSARGSFVSQLLLARALRCMPAWDANLIFPTPSAPFPPPHFGPSFSGRSLNWRNWEVSEGPKLQRPNSSGCWGCSVTPPIPLPPHLRQWELLVVFLGAQSS